MTSDIVVFLIGVVAIVASGMRLSLYGDEVAERFHLGGAVVGVVLLASVTSFPELVIGIMSGHLQSADFAVGNALGSNLYNMTILAVADGFHRTGTLLGSVSRNVLLSCALSQLLVAGAALALVVKLPLAIGWVGLDTIALFAAYACCLGMIARAQQREQMAVDAAVEGAPAAFASLIAAVPSRSSLERVETAEDVAPAPVDREVAQMAVELQARPLAAVSNRGLAWRVAACALVVLAAGPAMVHAAQGLSVALGLSASFVGVFLLAVAGSLPELVVSIGAVRVGAYDMAVGNVFGSNMFNIVLLLVSDLFYTRGPLLRYASGEHLIVALFVVALSSVAMVGLVFRSRRTFAGFGADSLLVLAGYVAAVAVLMARSSTP